MRAERPRLAEARELQLTLRGLRRKGFRLTQAMPGTRNDLAGWSRICDIRIPFQGEAVVLGSSF